MPDPGEKDNPMSKTVKLRATGGTIDIVHANQHFAPDPDGIFSIPADVATELMRMPMGLEVVASAEPEAAAQTVDFLAPSPFAVFNVAAIGGSPYRAGADAIVYGVAPEHCSMMLSNGCVPLPPVGWIDPRPKA